MLQYLFAVALIIGYLVWVVASRFWIGPAAADLVPTVWISAGFLVVGAVGIANNLPKALVEGAGFRERARSRFRLVCWVFVGILGAVGLVSG